MSYKLTYFDMAGRGEPARLLFAAAGVDFEDIRIKSKDWPKLKEKLGGGQLPVLQIGEDKTLTQSVTICRYLARKFKLMGEDEWEAARCDELVDSVVDLLAEFVHFAFKVNDPAKKEELKQAFVTEYIPKFLGKMNKIQATNGGSWLVGKQLSWADIVVVEYSRQMFERCNIDKTILDDFPNVKKVQDALFNNEKIKNYRDNAPETSKF